jgi:hypothetical protein
VNRLDGDYPIHVGTNATNGNGAYLTAGGVWTNASSRAKKDRFTPLSPHEVLEKIRSLPVEGWYYKGTNEYHIGPYAEDFYRLFQTGTQDHPESPSYLASSDVAGVALLGVQALAEHQRHQQSEQEVLIKRLEALEARVASLEAENVALRRELGKKSLFSYLRKKSTKL